MRTFLVPAAVLAFSGAAAQSSGANQQGSDHQAYYKNYLEKYQSRKDGDQKSTSKGTQASTSKGSQANQYGNYYSQYMTQYAGQGGGANTGQAAGYDKFFKQYMSKAGQGGAENVSLAALSPSAEDYFQQYLPEEVNVSSKEQTASAYRKEYASAYKKEHKKQPEMTGTETRHVVATQPEKQRAAKQDAGQENYTRADSAAEAAAADTVSLAALSPSAEDYFEQYLPEEVNVSSKEQTASAYMKEYISSKLEATDPKTMRDHFLKKYAAEYMPPKQEENVPMAPENCKTLKELHAWKAAKVWSIQKYVPKADQGLPLKNVEADFQSNKMRLQEAAAKADAQKAKDAKKAKEAKEAPAAEAAQNLRGNATAQTPEAVSLVAEVPASRPMLAIFAAAALPALGAVALLQKFKYFGSTNIDQPPYLLLSA